MKDQLTNFPALHRQYRNLLLDDLIPFWTRHAIDPAGGINTCIRDDGSVISRDKWLWSQWRAVWVFSTLYNMIEPRQQWLDIAQHICRFAARHGWNEKEAGFNLLLDHEGNVLRGCESIYADGFAIYGLTALARASGDDQAVALARRTADHVIRKLAAPHDTIAHFPYPIPEGARVHGLPMIFSLVLWELGQALDDDRYRQTALSFSDEIFSRFHQRDRDVVVERIRSDGKPYPGKLGSAVVPGHVIEDMWFQMHIARDCSDQARIAECVRLMLRHAELGWDDEEGGLYLAVDADGPKPPEEIGWEHADTKIWWPHTEALYGLLLAFEHSGDRACLDWYDRIHRYSFENYPVRDHGEWRQKLDRFGNPIDTVVALPVKDPFHLPRAVIYCIDVLERLTADGSD